VRLEKTENKLFVAIAVLGLSVAAGGARADALNGPYVGGGLAFDKGTVKQTQTFSGPGFSFSQTGTQGNDEHEVGLNLNGGYGATVGGGRFHVAGEISYQSLFGKTESSGTFGSTSSKLKDVWAISLLPGFKLGDETLAYARLGYAKAKGEFSNFTTSGGNVSKDFSGVLYGLGIKHAFNQHLAVVLEYQNLDLKAKDLESAAGITTNVKPGGNGFLLGVQYGF
jgi:opacity protein-like surface antigen